LFRSLIPRQRPGYPISSGDLNRTARQVEWLSRLRGTGNIRTMDTPQGPLLQQVLPATIYAVLTGPANGIGGYPWKEEVRLPDGTWMETGVTGTNVAGADFFDPTYERRTGSLTVPQDGRRYLMGRTPSSGEWMFAYRVVCKSQDTLCFIAPGCGLDSQASRNIVTVIDADGNVVGEGGASFGVFGGQGGWHTCIDGIPPGTYTATITSNQGPIASQGFEYKAPCSPLTVTIPGYGCMFVPSFLTYTGFIGGVPGFLPPTNGTTFSYQDTPADLQGFGIFNDLISPFCAKFPDKVWCSPVYPPLDPTTSPWRFAVGFTGCLATAYQVFTRRVNGIFWVLNTPQPLGALGGGGNSVNTCFPFSITVPISVQPFAFSLTGTQNNDSIPFDGTLGGVEIVDCP